jgi:hypothetical protein
MIIVCAQSTARRFAFYSALPVFMTALSCPGYSQTSVAPPKPCNEAQVIAIQGSWIANPGAYPLGNWSCVSPGQEIVLADGSAKGQITIIYHRGARIPHTVRCASRAQCRNAYRVEAPPATPIVSRSAVDQIIDFFFSIFPGRDSQPVPGILQGAVRPQPVLACSVRQRVELEDLFKPGAYTLQVKALNEQAEDVTWQAENVVDGRTYTGVAWADLMRSEPGASHGSLVMGKPLERPAFYEVNAQPIGTNAPNPSVWLLIAPEALCEPLRDSYEQAVTFTKTWPKNTPSEAVANFRLRYLQGLASQPDKAPVDKAHR